MITLSDTSSEGSPASVICDVDPADLLKQNVDPADLLKQGGEEEPFPAAALMIHPPNYTAHRAKITLTSAETFLPFELPEEAAVIIGNAYAGSPSSLEDLQLVHNLYVTGAIPGII